MIRVVDMHGWCAGLMLATGLLLGTAGADRTNDQDRTADVVPVLLEVPYWHGQQPRPEKPMQASIEDARLGAWNLGGTGDAEYPTNRSQFHAAVRVIVDTRVLSGRVPKTGKSGLTQKSILAQARSRGYWLVRACYEQALREQQAHRPARIPPARPSASLGERVSREQAARRKAAPQGKTVLRFSIEAAGKVSYVRRIRSELPPAAAECLKKSWYDLHFDPGPGRRVDVEATIRVYPGDAPLPAIEASAFAGEPLPALARAEHVLERVLPKVEQCYEAGLARDRKLWGRVELRLSLDAKGKVQASREGSSRFPDAQVVVCLQDLVQGQQLPVSAPAPAVRVDGASLASPGTAPSLSAVARRAAGQLPELVVAWRLKPGQDPKSE